MILIALLLLVVGIWAAWLVRPRRQWPRGEHPKFFRQP